MSAPSGCRSDLDPRYYRLCDLAEAWGIALETLAAVGAVATVAFMFALLILICKVQDSNRRKVLPTQFLFLLGVLGVFGLTFAFIIKLDGATGPTRFFLFGVLFAVCFSCLLAHAFDLIKLVRGRKPLSWLVILSLAVGFSLVQDVIAIEYLVLTMNRTNVDVFSELPAPRRNEDFVMLLIYVLLLMALTFFASLFVFCGSFPGWKRHGAHICLTSFASIAIWVAWIVLLLIPDIRPEWDDTILCTALVANGWAFLAFYVFPEFLLLPKQRSPTDYPVEDAFCKPQLMKQSYGVENRAYSQEEITQGLETGDTLYAPYSTHFQLQNRSPPKDFSIPRAQAPASPYNNYEGRKGDS
ncbi:retinoic acid-induced protein 3 [Mesocricetus auratus]|uniref:Retinoic acid-induced protein 3 n=1 Tax=Mesocricetus auratus TaxID=10036 RepID=A0A1U7Q8K6_MESAU|nr:retinoic acid-induced protein 3 [Mesocricetus auratus]